MLLGRVTALLRVLCPPEYVNRLDVARNHLLVHGCGRVSRMGYEPLSRVPVSSIWSGS